MHFQPRWVLPLMLTAVTATLVLAAAGDGAWMRKVPEKDRARTNPFANDAQAIQVGAKLFQQNCTSCHGRNAEGTDHKPPLRSERIHAATPGELHWLLTNGSLKNGMPSWARLPDQQRWQIVTYLKSLQ